MACELETEAERLYNATGIGTMAAAREVAEILVARDRAWARLVEAVINLRDAVAIDLADRARGCPPGDLSKESDAAAAAKRSLRELGVDVDALTAE